MKTHSTVLLEHSPVMSEKATALSANPSSFLDFVNLTFSIKPRVQMEGSFERQRAKQCERNRA
jgi:hypothetical protein